MRAFFSKRVAQICCADVPIIAALANTLALPIRTMVAGGASVSVVAFGHVRFEDTPGDRVAGVVRAHIEVIACDGAPRSAEACTAHIAGCAGIAVVTRVGVVGVGTPKHGGANLVRAGVPVIATCRNRASADSQVADILESAWILVIAFQSVVLVGAAGCWIARIVRADVSVIADSHTT